MSQPLISIVDDDETVRDAIQTFVHSLGYHGSTFASANEFLKSERFTIPRALSPMCACQG
jgi:FixJ family two-component response regulator